MNKKTAQSAFTLIELLVVIAIIAVLATVVFVALNPAERLLDARNARRTNDVQNYLTAIHECIVDNGGSLTSCGLGSVVSGTEYHISSAAVTDCTVGCTAVADEADCLNMTTPLANYLATLPVDPSGAPSTNASGYYLRVNTTSGIVTIGTCATEGAAITVSR